MTEYLQIEQMVLAQLGRPLRKLAADFAQHLEARFEFNTVALTVIEGDGLDALIRLERMRETGRGILTTGKQNESGFVHPQMLGHVRSSLRPPAPAYSALPVFWILLGE